MRHWLFAFLLFVVPSQMILASAAPYCAHETSTAAKKHFGHHEHRHQAGGDIRPALDDNGTGSGAYHADCESCHLGCSVTLPTPTLAIDTLPRGAVLGHHDPCCNSHVPSGPERPDRSDLTAAARFGGGVAFGAHNT